MSNLDDTLRAMPRGIKDHLADGGNQHNLDTFATSWYRRHNMTTTTGAWTPHGKRVIARIRQGHTMTDLNKLH